MDKITKVRAKKYLDTIKKANKKFVTSSYISKTLGIQEDVVREELSYFDDLIRLLDDFNLVEIIPMLNAYINTRVKREILQSFIKILSAPRGLLRYRLGCRPLLYQHKILNNNYVPKDQYTLKDKGF